ncbi:MAG: hypothetical protein Kow0042_30860 [Calditrichia bacterium]
MLKSPDLLIPLLEELARLSEEIGWAWSPFAAEELNLQGGSLQVHPAAESLSFYFDPHGRLLNIAEAIFRQEGRSEPEQNESDALHLCWCKTQFAGPVAHKTVIELLVYLQKKYFLEMEILDEGGYYPHRNEKELLKRMQFLDRMTNAFEMLLANGELPDDFPEAQKEQLHQTWQQLQYLLKFVAKNPYLNKTN